MVWRAGVIGTVLWAGTALAGDVEVVATHFQQQGSSWTVDATLRHGDTGWEHYTDAWRVVTEKGEVLGTRTLYHPHENEQPFTRNLGNLLIPKGLNLVFVEAHDKVHGWSAQRIRIDLRQPKGERYTLRRQ